MEEDNLHFFVIRIRKIAAEHQAGKCLKEAKQDVDLIIQKMRNKLGPDKIYQAQQWTQLLEQLACYNNSISDPKWEIIITHARNRIKSRKRTALYYASLYNNRK